MTKKFYVNNRKCVVTLEKQGGFWIVKVDGDVHYKGANELFAVQKFQEI